MLEIYKSTLFDPIENLKGIGPKTLQLFEKLCGTKIIDLLLTIPRGFKKREHIKEITGKYLKEEIIILTSKKYKQFFLDSHLVNKILVDDRKGLIASIYFINKILKMNIDLVINLQNSGRTTIYELFFRLLATHSF